MFFVYFSLDAVSSSTPADDNPSYSGKGKKPANLKPSSSSNQPSSSTSSTSATSSTSSDSGGSRSTASSGKPVPKWFKIGR